MRIYTNVELHKCGLSHLWSFTTVEIRSTQTIHSPREKYVIGLLFPGRLLLINLFKMENPLEKQRTEKQMKKMKENVTHLHQSGIVLRILFKFLLIANQFKQCQLGQSVDALMPSFANPPRQVAARGVARVHVDTVEDAAVYWGRNHRCNRRSNDSQHWRMPLGVQLSMRPTC